MPKVMDNLRYSDDLKTVLGVENKEITTAIIKEGVTEIGEDAFDGCENLQNVTIPESVKMIGEYAFFYCTNLQNIDIPEGVTKIGEKAFKYCKIENYEHKIFKIKNGCFLSSDEKTVLYCSNASKEEFVIPEGVTTIGSQAFRDCTNLQNVVIPSSVTELGEKAFEGCKNLQEVKYLGTAKEWGKVKFAKSKEKAEIRKLIKAFTLQDAKDAKIKEIKTVSVEGIMNAMKEIYPSFTFQILNTTKTNQALFVMGGKNATVIQLSSNVSSWKEKVQSFLSVFCDETKTNEEINEAFTTYKIKIAEIKKNFQKPQIDVDEMNLFIDELPEMKKEYNSHSVSFFYNAKIKKLTFARNTLIDWCTFKRNKSFESIILPKGVTRIAYGTFYECSNLQNVVIPESVTEIGEEAFSYCKNLQNVVIPDSVTEIRREAFKGCKIENYKHKIFNVKNGCFLSSDEKTVLYCSNYSKQEIVIPEGVTEIGGRAFHYCDNLQSVTISEGVTTIEYYAFWGCNNLQSVVIPSSVKTIRYDAFRNCPNLTVTFDGTKEEWDKIEGVEKCGAKNVKFNK